MPSSNPLPHRSPFGDGRFGSRRKVAVVVLVTCITLLIAALFAAIIGTSVGSTGTRQPPDIFHFLRMTALQAGLTTLLSLSVGIGIAWALNRLKFPGRNAIASLFATAIVAPGIVVAFGLIAVWGRAGWVSDMLDVFGLQWTSSIFGLQGILAAHVILDGAFAARVLLTRLDALPAVRLKTGQSLGFGAWQRFRIVDWPALSGALPGLGAIIFLLAFTSFPIVLVLGGGPANQTLEVAIYSAVRLNFDLDAAVLLALVQLAVCTLVIAPALYFTPDISMGGSAAAHHWPERPIVRILAAVILALGLAGFAAPLAATLANGLAPGIGAVLTQPQFWSATGVSLSIGISSALLTALIAVALSLGRNAFQQKWIRLGMGLPAYAYLIVPAVVLSLGFFLIVRNFGIQPARAAPVVLITANALLALPFAISVLAPALNAIDQRYTRTARSLALTGWQRWRYVEMPLLRNEIALIFALGFCFSLGDLGVISLFGTSDFSTLPWLMYRALGSYRTNDAAAIAALLLLLTFAAFWLTPWLMKDRKEA